MNLLRRVSECSQIHSSISVTESAFRTQQVRLCSASVKFLVWASVSGNLQHHQHLDPLTWKTDEYFIVHFVYLLFQNTIHPHRDADGTWSKLSWETALRIGDSHAT
jgi:hypothetical protein